MANISKKQWRRSLIKEPCFDQARIVATFVIIVKRGNEKKDG